MRSAGREVITSHSVCHLTSLVWTSRLGRTYSVRPPPIIEPLPDPLPAERPSPLLPSRSDDIGDAPNIWDDTSGRGAPAPDAGTEPAPHDDDAPRFDDSDAGSATCAKCVTYRDRVRKLSSRWWISRW